MSMRIITGSTGSTHVTSNDDGCYNQALWGAESTILDVGEKLEASIVDNNTIQLKDGDILLQGRHARINPNTTEDVAIGTGSVGNNRNDLIVARYTLDDTTGYEDISIVVIEGTETSGSATDPEYTEGDIRTGSTLVDFPLYRVKIEGINITAVELLAPVKSGFADAISEINNNLTNLTTWKLLGSVEGLSTTITLPTEWKELMLLGLASPTAQGRNSTYIIKDMLDYGSTTKQQFETYGSTIGGIRYNFSGNTVCIDYAEKITNPKLIVWYR